MSSIYDPVGLIHPFIVKGKLLLQESFNNKGLNNDSLKWDDNVPKELADKWEDWIEDIETVSTFKVKRYLFEELAELPKREEMFLHTFGDAGGKCWGICSYVHYPLVYGQFFRFFII